MPRKEQLKLPVLPLKNTVLFPRVDAPLVVARQASVAAIEAAMGREDKFLIVASQKDPDNDTPGPTDIYPIGTLAVLRRAIPAPDRLQIHVHGVDRVKLLDFPATQPCLQAHAVALPPPTDGGTEVEALQREILNLAGRIYQLMGAPGSMPLTEVMEQLTDPVDQVYLLASLLSFDVDKQQALLEADKRLELLRLMHQYLLHELQVRELHNTISNEAVSEISKEQRDYFLRHQLKAIQSALGEQSPEAAEVVELRQRLAEAELPEAVQKEADKALARLERMAPQAPDYQVTRTHLELLIELPWHAASTDNLDLQRARAILDEDHYDLKDVKERIIEHLAVMRLNPQAKSPILCLVGPPGVGKTSIGQSIARALGRQFERLSLGGLHDEAELRGHRRTYIGAMPGRIIEAIRRAGVRNPLLMLDEVDKLGRDFRGDPAAALMEILDPAQNNAFHDNYLDIPFDLSKVFFITTANTLDAIPAPLLDRLETLRLAGYSATEKQAIARRYLLPRQILETGLTSEQLTLTDAALLTIIGRYTREAGVRELERTLGRLARKVATRFADGSIEPVTLDREDLRGLLGAERYFQEEARRHLPVGVAIGLAWTEVGGEVLYVEAALLPDGQDIILTGQLGNVMQESARTARGYIWSHTDTLGIAREQLTKSGVHLHVPAGATPKDGPSAGVTMVTAFASLYTGQPTRSDTAMTGEITLSGLVLPVGGVKEKVLAAHRAGLKRVLLPKHNLQDLEELPGHVSEALEFIPVEQIDEVLKAAFAGV